MQNRREGPSSRLKPTFQRRRTSFRPVASPSIYLPSASVSGNESKRSPRMSSGDPLATRLTYTRGCFAKRGGPIYSKQASCPRQTSTRICGESLSTGLWSFGGLSFTHWERARVDTVGTFASRATRRHEASGNAGRQFAPKRLRRKSSWRYREAGRPMCENRLGRMGLCAPFRRS